MKRLVCLACLVVLGCGGGSTSGGGTTTADSPPVGNAAVTARIATVPAAPVPLTTQVSALTTESATSLCPWVQEHVAPSELDVDCPDGSHVHTGGGCEAEGLVQMATQFSQVSCSLNLGELFACQLAVRADPCGGGAFGANHAECEAMTECIRVSFAQAQAAQTPASDDAPAQ